MRIWNGRHQERYHDNAVAETKCNWKIWHLSADRPTPSSMRVRTTTPCGERASVVMAAVESGRSAMEPPPIDPEGDATDRLRVLYPSVNEEKTPLPRSWSPKEKYNYIGLSQNNLRVHYKGKSRECCAFKVRRREKRDFPTIARTLGRRSDPIGVVTAAQTKKSADRDTGREGKFRPRGYFGPLRVRQRFSRRRARFSLCSGVATCTRYCFDLIMAGSSALVLTVKRSWNDSDSGTTRIHEKFENAPPFLFLIIV